MTEKKHDSNNHKMKRNRNKEKEVILLMGNPNVGKSVFFSRMTGVHVASSNFAGTTVTYTEGTVKVGDNEYTLIDVPGTYSMVPVSEAEIIATKFMESQPAAVICVLDATNLKRNIKFALELKQYDVPIIFTLNLMDVASRHGTQINVPLLQQELNAPIIPTVAVKGEGFDRVLETLDMILTRPPEERLAGCASCAGCPLACPGKNEDEDDAWQCAEQITRRVRKDTKNQPNFLDKLGQLSMKPWPGVPLALVILAISLGIIVGGGEILREFILLPLVEGIIVPFFRWLFELFVPEGMLLNILIGDYGIFVISFDWIIALILPYVFLFYVVFSFLEDSGYFPRISILFDNIMSKLGVQGGSIISLLMGYGCAVPAIIGTRAATTMKERKMIAIMICFAVPCISQTGALIALLGSHSVWLILVMMFMSLFIIAVSGFVAGKVLKGKVDPLVIEVPNFLIPERKTYFKKLRLRMRHFLYEAEVPMLIAIVFAAVLKETGLLDFLSVALEPFVSGWLGLPKEAVIGLILGVVRREMAAAPLLALDLTALQIFVGSTVALLYLPCISVFAILTREFKFRTALAIGLATTASAFIIGGLINQIGQLFI